MSNNETIAGQFPDGGTPEDSEYLDSTSRFNQKRDELLSNNPKVKEVHDRRTVEIGSTVTSLTAVRNARNLTQQQLADALGLTQGEISKIERRLNVTIQTLARFIEATGGTLELVANYASGPVRLDLKVLAIEYEEHDETEDLASSVQPAHS